MRKKGELTIAWGAYKTSSWDLKLGKTESLCLGKATWPKSNSYD